MEQNLEFYHYQQALSGNYAVLKQYAQRMRAAPTPAEALLWGYLRGSRQQGLHFRRQHVMYGYIVDFICLTRWLIVELDGGIHNRPDQQAWDAQRTLKLEAKGYQVLRYPNEAVFAAPWKVTTEIVAAALARPHRPLKGDQP
ncbi:endonuclease domain-containing protein [Flaviaesturariibacter amylovorans]|uniref:DUF559 domain-containing protein n=1 Tax=Flaviaesturariibacter amylovorans TaxID=1084520 RepID=A0ABP8G4E4_9BACT